jgi:uncharacterized protein (DUF1778 family)
VYGYYPYLWKKIYIPVIMKAIEKTRFDARLPVEQKELFEYAAALGGFRSLTDFIIYSVQQQTTLIVEKHNTILASKKDQKIFFDSIMHPAKPNARLKKAAQRYNRETAKK